MIKPYKDMIDPFTAVKDPRCSDAQLTSEIYLVSPLGMVWRWACKDSE